MPTASRNVRKTRRVKRERTRAYKMLDFALNQRDQARLIAGQLEAELRKRDHPDLTITKIDETKDHEESVQAAQELGARDE